MRGEFIFILLLIAGLLALTAFRYRRQILAAFQMAKMLRQAKKSMSMAGRSIEQPQTKSNALVNCSKCDIWVPQDRAVKFREGFICSSVCVNAEVTRN